RRLARIPGRAAMLPAAADVLQRRARHLEGTQVAERAPDLDTALLERNPLVGTLLDVAVEEVIHGKLLDGVALGVDVAAFGEQRVHLARGLGLVLGARFGAGWPGRRAEELRADVPEAAPRLLPVDAAPRR